jgi:hypothetical protein
MTDHVPNDFSHLSEEEFNALCPQGEHAPGPKPLSPAAQAIEDAVDNAWSNSRARAAAALRAVVHGVDYITSEQLLAIADELEGHDLS